MVAANGLIHIMGGDYCYSYETYNPECDTWTHSSIKFKQTPDNPNLSTYAFVLQPKSNINLQNIFDYYSGILNTKIF